MAAATVTGKRQNNVSGNRRVIYANSVAFAADGDTWNTGLRQVQVINLTPSTDPGGTFWFDVSNGTLTLQSSGAITFRGSVEGY